MGTTTSVLRGAVTSLVLGAGTLAAQGCVGDREAIVRVPISRLELPEQGPRLFNIGFGVTGEAQAVLTNDQASTPPDPVNPGIREDRDGILRFEASPIPLLSVSLKGASDLGQVQAKLMPLRGRGPFQVAATVAYGGGEDEFNYNDGAVVAKTDAKSSLRDAALILGWRADQTLMLYGGGWYSHLHYRGHHRSDRGSAPDFAADYDGRVEAVGGNVGLAANFGRWGRSLAEYSHARVRAGQSRDDVGHGALTLEFFFGPLLMNRDAPL